MDTGRKNIDTILFEAVEIESAAEREAFLNEACGEETELRHRVDKLVADHFRAGDFLEISPVGVAASIDMPPLAERPGTMVGHYKLLQQIGEGGMGVVYMAEQQEPVDRKVALKIIKPGMDTEQVIARFEAERQALAMMNHPNIAHVLDAGATESGRPYFVMELVKGIPITAYCDEHHLEPKQRLGLFVTACEAVQHAHQKGIIHRDIKSSNVLVAEYDDRAVVKIIDFGVAKATSQRLTAKTMFTQLGQVVGTLEYMSPEQAKLNQMDVDTRTDIYSLGVLLYELLTGSTPFDAKRLRTVAFEEVMRIIREEEPPRPSTRLSTIDSLPVVAANRHVEPQRLTTIVRGELDWIVMKALEKERARRYETANSFAADIQRYLSDDAVVACPPSAAYRFRKFARRNKTALATTLLVAAALIFGLIGTAWQAVRATQAEGAAKTERDVARTERNRAVEARRLADDRLRRAVTAEEKTREQLASSYVDRAQSLCEQGEISRGLLWLAHALKETPANSSDLSRAIRTSLAAWYKHLHPLRVVLRPPWNVGAIAFTPDGSRILSDCDDGFLRLWDVSTGEVIAQVTRPGERISGLGFSPDRSQFITGHFDGAAQLWDLATLSPLGEPLRHSPTGTPPSKANRVKCMDFSPDGSMLVTASGWGSDGLVRVWDAKTLEPVGQPFARGRTLGLGFCRSASDEAESSSYSLRIVTHIGGGMQQMFAWENGEPVGPAVKHGGTWMAQIDADGSRFATAGGGGVRVWETATGECVLPSMPTGTLYTLASSPDGTSIATGGLARTAILWDSATGKPIGEPLRHRATVESVRFSIDGDKIATMNEAGVVRVWDLAHRHSPDLDVRHEDEIVSAVFAREGLRILTRGEDGLTLRDAKTGNAVGAPFPDHGLPGSKLTLSPDASQLSTCNWLIDLRTGKKLESEFGDRPVFSRDGLRILTGSGSGVVELWDATTLNLIGELRLHQELTPGPTFSPDGSRLLTGSFDGTTRLWDAATLQPIGQSLTHQSEVKSLAYSPDGTRILVGFADGTVGLWDPETLESKGTPLQFGNIVCSVDFSPDGSRLLACSIGQTTARLWDTATLKPIGPPLEHDCGWPDAVFSPDGSQILLVDNSGTIQLWDAPPGPLNGDLEQVTCWVQVVTGMELDPDTGHIVVLDEPSWRRRRQELQEMGGPPSPAPLPPPAPSPETDFSRSMNLALSGRDHAAAGQWNAAAADLAKALELSGNSPTLRTQTTHWLGQSATRQSGNAQGIPAAEEGRRRALELLSELGLEVPRFLSCGAGARRIRLAELSGQVTEGYPWVTPDGLTVYWTREGGRPDLSGIWVAHRSDHDAKFVNPRRLCQGRHATVTADRLEMVLVVDKALHVAERESVDQDFPKPVRIADFTQPNAKCPAFSFDGLSIVFNVSGRVYQCIRSDRDSPWSDPQEIPVEPSAAGSQISWPSLNRDGLRLWFTLAAGGSKEKFVLASRDSLDSAFNHHQVLHYEGQPLEGRAPRYVESTDELFYCAPRRPGSRFYELWVIKDVSLDVRPWGIAE